MIYSLSVRPAFACVICKQRARTMETLQPPAVWERGRGRGRGRAPLLRCQRSALELPAWSASSSFTAGHQCVSNSCPAALLPCCPAAPQPRTGSHTGRAAPSESNSTGEGSPLYSSGEFCGSIRPHWQGNTSPALCRA